MRIAYVCCDPGVPVFGTKGCSIHAQEVLRGFLRAGGDITLMAARMGGCPPPDLAGLRLVQLPVPASSDLSGRERSLIGLNETVVRALGDLGPLDFVYERHALFAYGAMEAAAANGVPGVLEVNAPLVEEQAKHRSLLDRDGAERAARRAFDHASAVVAVSDEVGAYVKGRTGRPGRIRTIPNGVDLARFRVCGERRNGANVGEGGAVTIGFLGTLKPWHGTSVLLQAFTRVRGELPAARLLIVGDGPEREALMEQARRSGDSDAVEFTGAVSSDRVPGLLTRMDVAVAPYPALTDFYFSPLKVYEYMAARCAVVASRIGQLEGLITDGENGFLTEPGDPKALSDRLLKLCRDRGLRLRLGASAYRTIEDGHTWECVVARILNSVDDAKRAMASMSNPVLAR